MINNNAAVNEQSEQNEIFESRHLCSEFYCYFSRINERIADDASYSLFSDVRNANTCITELANTLKSINTLWQLIYKVRDNNGASFYLYNAAEYLQYKVRAMLKQEDWLMSYMVDYAAEYFQTNKF